MRAGVYARAGLYALVILAVLSGTAQALVAPKARLWPYWQAHDANSKTTVEHSDWDTLLKKYIVLSDDGVNRFRYSAVTGADREALEGYISRLEGAEVSELGRAGQRAYWINLYNALTVKVILDYYPVSSIRKIDISPRLFADGPWDKKLLRIEGRKVSLNDIEHRILRPIWRDPRIHYAVNCAAIGCPNLERKAYTPANTEAMLDEAARQYVNHPRGARVERGRLRVSSIYVWFMEDFGGTKQGVIEHLRRYAGPELKGRLRGITRISGHDYDWSLNE